MLLTTLYLRVLCIQTLWILCKYIHTVSTALYKVKYYIYEVKWNCQSMIKWSWQLKYSYLDSITSSATENPLLLLHCCRNSPQFIELPTLQKIAQIWQVYSSILLPFMPHIWKFSIAHFPLYLQDSSHAGILMWYKAWSQSTIKGVLLFACITPIYFSVLWSLLLLVFWN